MALEVEYQKTQILERINIFFGYQAVTSIRIIQGPVQSAALEKQRTAPILRKPVSDLDLSEIEDEGLRNALESLNAARQKRR